MIIRYNTKGYVIRQDPSDVFHFMPALKWVIGSKQVKSCPGGSIRKDV